MEPFKWKQMANPKCCNCLSNNAKLAHHMYGSKKLTFNIALCRVLLVLAINSVWFYLWFIINCTNRKLRFVIYFQQVILFNCSSRIVNKIKTCVFAPILDRFWCSQIFPNNLIWNNRCAWMIFWNKTFKQLLFVSIQSEVDWLIPRKKIQSIHF